MGKDCESKTFLQVTMDKSKLEIDKDMIRRASLMTTSDVFEFERKQKMKYGGPLQAAWALFSDFTNNSTVHGVKYLGERRRHWAERVFWIIAFFISVVGCSIMIHKIYEKWQLSPVIVSFAEKSTPVWEIPFPAVTICPETKLLKKHVDFTKGYLAVMREETANFTNDEMKALEAVAQICDPHLFAMHNMSLGSGLKPDEIVPLLRKMSVPLNESTLFCKWRNTVGLCDQFFTEIITEEGFCYTFNVLDSSQLFKEEV
jgi:acid-sensing ion channel, other